MAEKKQQQQRIAVTCKVNGFRRAGRAWSDKTELDASELTEAQWQQLEDDDMFVLQSLDQDQGKD